MLKKSWATLLVLLAFSLNLHADNHKDKDQDHNEDKSDFPHAKLELNLLKKKHYAPMPVELDASKSTAKKGNTLVMYEFDFGDGGPKKLINSSKVNHIFEILGNKDKQKYEVSLRVQDNLGNWSKVAKKNVELKQIPDPGELGKKTIKGIDVDEDGVRDDIQLYISHKFKDETPIVREALRKYSISITKNLLSSQNKIQNVIDSHATLDRLMCVLYFKSKNKNVDEKVYGRMINTKERVLAETLSDKNFNGETRRLKQNEDHSKFCDFDLNQF